MRSLCRVPARTAWRLAVSRHQVQQNPSLEHLSLQRACQARTFSRALTVACKNGLLASPPQQQPRHQQQQFQQFSQQIQILNSADLDDEDPHIAYELLQGALVRWTRKSGKTPPTAVLVHGILGARKNMQSFARMLLEGFPSWQVLLVDLRCHGESASLPNRRDPPHTVATAAQDILLLLRELKLFPHALIGHSYGGKVVMSMVHQFGQRLPRPVQVWVLDSLPGEVRVDGGTKDHPARLIRVLQEVPTPIDSRNTVIKHLSHAGFSDHIARWTATNLRPLSHGASSELTWIFDLKGIEEMYQSYEVTSLWPLLEKPPEGLKLDFVKAEGSTFRWGGPDEEYIKSLGHKVHLLCNAGHWVHTDNPIGLFDILASSFGEVDLHQRRPGQQHSYN